MEKMIALKQQLAQLRLNHIKEEVDQIIHQAGVDQLSLTDYSMRLLEKEIIYRKNKSIQAKLKQAKLPAAHDLEQFDFTHQNGITKDQLDQLRELLWLDQHYNLLLMGPSGTGKIFPGCRIGLRCHLPGLLGLIPYCSTVDRYAQTQRHHPQRHNGLQAPVFMSFTCYR